MIQIGKWIARVVHEGRNGDGSPADAVLSEICGGVLAEVHAPEAGVPLFLTTSPAVLADGLLLGLARGTGRT